jgi:hypothetical protein
MKAMNEALIWTGLFDCWDHNLTNSQLRDLMTRPRWEKSRWLSNHEPRKNLLMAVHKLAMANLIFPTIDHLVITADTTAPRDTESTYTAFYETSPSEVTLEALNTNPAQMAWNIQSASANGTWGSFILVNEYGEMINRALALVTKSANTRKLVQFTGRVQ